MDHNQDKTIYSSENNRNTTEEHYSKRGVRGWLTSYYVSTTWKTLLFYFLVGAGLLGTVLGTLLSVGAWWLSYSNLGFMQTEQGIVFDQSLVGLASTMSLLLMALSVAWLTRLPYARRFIQNSQDGHLFKKPTRIHVAYAIITPILFFAALQAFGYIANTFFHLNMDSSDTSKQVAGWILNHDNDAIGWFTCIMLALSTCVFAPLTEEIIYRGFIGRAIIDSGFMRTADGTRTHIGNMIACLLSGLFFGLAHLQPSAIITMTILGAIFTWLTSVKTKNLTTSMIAHMIYNTIGMIALLLPTLLA